MIENLREDFLYQRLPEGLIELDERGLIQAVVGGYQDRLEDLRSYSRKLELLFQTNGLPETGDNVVLVDITTDQGKVYTRSLDIMSDTPADGIPALTVWVLIQLGDVDPDRIANVRYGRDLLRLVDANTLDYLAVTIGAVLYQSEALSSSEQTVANQQIVQTYFNRLKFKGTADSFTALGRLLGFDDVKITPLFGRMSPRKPNDVGSPDNDQDFSAESEYQPQQAINPFYDPLKTNDGPFFTWSGTVNNGTASTQFYTEAINGFNPWIEVSVLAVQGGTVVAPSAGSYALAGGGPHVNATVTPDGSGLLIKAIGEGEYFNGLEVHVVDSGTNQVFSISDRLSSIKYRTSYFDLALTAEFDRAEELYGSSAMKRNKDLAANPTLTTDGTAVSPYRPWTAGSISTGLVYQDFLVRTGTETPTIIEARVQSTGTDRQLNVDSLVAAGVQVTQALEEVRPATRIPRKAGIGFLIRDSVGYAAYTKETVLFTSNGTQTFFSGTASDNPDYPYIAEIAFQNGDSRAYATAGEHPTNDDLYNYMAPNFSGSFNFSTGSWGFNFASTSGTQVIALWKPTSTEVVREEPTAEKAYQARPEDQENGLTDEVVDEYPWRRDLVVGGELEDETTYNPIVADLASTVVDTIMSVPSQEGAEYSVYGIDSASGLLRLTSAVRNTLTTYQPGMPAIAYRGELRNLAAIPDADKELINTSTDLETLFESGAALYNVGLVQGVLVADPARFFSDAHRTGLVGWFPFNEHMDDDLPPVDHSAMTSNLTPLALNADARAWDYTRGWFLTPTFGSVLQSSKVRVIGDDFSMSFWFKPGASTSEVYVYAYGPLAITWNGTALKFYWNDANDEAVLIGTVYPTAAQFTFLCVSKTGDDIFVGYGDLSTAIAAWYSTGDWAGFTDEDDILTVIGTDYGLSDLRMWNVGKTTTELNSIRDYDPEPTQVNWHIGSFLSLNHHDRYALKVLATGLCAAAPLPAWYRVPRLKWVRRYDSLGLFTGESRRKEVGLGGGPPPPSTPFTLGLQFYNLTGDGRTVVSTQHGIMPGVNDQWLNANIPPLYLKVVHTGSDATDHWVSSGTAAPWPNEMTQTNPNQDRVWVDGDDGYMYEITLESSGTGARMVADFIARERTEAELVFGGSGTAAFNYSEQPTGAQTILAGSSKILTVGYGGTSVYVKPYSGTRSTPPFFLYLNSRTIVDVPRAWTNWTENSDTSAFGNEQSPQVAALDEDGVLEFSNTGTIVPGNYRLTVISGNIGKVDEDFDGFQVDITVDATTIQERLSQGQSDYNFTGTDTFDFEIENGVVGEWLLSFDWTNAFNDPARGEARQMAIHSYKLEHLTTELYKVSLPTSGTDANLTLMQTGSYDGTTPGGWLADYNSYGTVAQWTHESQSYPTNDTLTSKFPLSEILTGNTAERREDVLGPLAVSLVDETTGTMPSFGTLSEPAVQTPMWFWVGGITGDSAVITTRLPADSALVQAVVSETGSLTDPVYSDVGVADSATDNIVKLTVEGLQPNKSYYYGISTGGSVATGFLGRFRTWDETTRNFTFGLASCANNTILAGVNPGVFDTIRNKDPLFFLHMGDMHYNDTSGEPVATSDFRNAFSKVFQFSTRQKEFWQKLAVPYIWDDHDFGPNDANGSFANKANSREAYQQVVPHYPLAAGSGNVPIYQSFAVGRCWFILLDVRSEADLQSKTDNASKTRLGATQKAWLKQQLLFARDNYAVTFIVSPVTWGGAASAASDTWAGYATERREIIDFIVANSCTGVFILSGDAHSCALDDGTNNAFGTGSTGGMVCMQAAPLHQTSSIKGTPYSTGPFPDPAGALKNQYGMITVVDSGAGTPYLTFTAYDDTSSSDTLLFTESFYGTQSPA